MRLDTHVERLAEIERKLDVIGQLASAPPVPAVDSNVYWEHHSFPHDPDENRLFCGLINDILVAVFSAGVSRVAAWHQNTNFADQLIQDWHGQVAHTGFGADVAQGRAVGWNQGTFKHIMVDLAAKMTPWSSRMVLRYSTIVYCSLRKKLGRTLIILA
ncbi:MAG: hypothetical protein GY822_05985 [Deltaproteobacteria bacterium]|nr:hypothetical protein [Deltaproteobacteria bacterium]